MTDMGLLARALRLEWLVGPRYARWVRVGVCAGAVMGVIAYAAALAYFELGPGRENPDRGEAHGYWIMAAGHPLSLVLGWVAWLGPVLGHALLAVSVATMWGIHGGVCAGVTSAIHHRVHGRGGRAAHGSGERAAALPTRPFQRPRYDLTLA